MSYEDLLKKAMEKLPKRLEEEKRFAIPQVVCEISGTKTFFRNFVEVANALRRDMPHLSKYLFKELATPGTMQGNILIFQRKVSKEMLEGKLKDYAKEFVFCKECKEPDTKLIKEDKLFFIKCEACGAKYPVRSI